MAQYPDDSGIINVAGFTIMMILLFSTACYLASYGVKSRLISMILCMAATAPILFLNTSDNERLALIMIWIYISLMLWFLVLTTAGWGMQSDIRYHDIYVHAD